MISRATKVVSVFSYAMRLSFSNAPVPTVLLVLEGLVAGLGAPLIVWSLTGIIDTIARTPDETWIAVSPWLSILLIVLILQSVEDAGSRYLAERIRERVDTSVQREIFVQAISLPLVTFEKAEYYQKLETGRRALGSPLLYALKSFSTLTSTLIGSIGLVMLYFQAHYSIALMLLLTLMGRSVVSARMGAHFTRVNYQSSPLRREVNYWASVLSSRQMAAEIRLFGLGKHLQNRWRSVFQRYLVEISRARSRIALYTVASIVAQEAISLIVVLGLLLLALSDSITIGSLVALLYGLGQLRSFTETLGWTIQDLLEHGSRLTHLREFLELRTLSEDEKRLEPPKLRRNGIEFRDVSFTYPGSDHAALKHISFLIRPGERIAVVGENGAGKTTLARLLLGLYSPATGKILVDGVDLEEIDQETWRREATAVFQDFMQYPTTIGENIAYADCSLLIHGTDMWKSVHPRIVSASRQSGAEAFIAQFPASYATPLGKEFAGAVDLSMGQWQRLALARAYLRNARVIVLDEPTAALDPRGEVEIYREFSDAATGRSAILISHRLGSARLAERIIVLRSGRIVEQGNHESLLAQNGEYARMYRLQAEHYSEGLLARNCDG